MSPDKPAPPDFAPLAGLAAESAAWQGLLDILQDEERALIEGEADRLAQLNTAKLTQLQTASEHARKRHADLLAAGHAADRASVDAWLAQHGRPEQRARWQRLCALEQEVQAANQRIGSLIELRLNSTRQALNVLIHAATSQGGLYDHAGLAVAATKGKPLTAA
ncbi:MAG: flagellar biosynthesis protein FlgN [Thiobacillus sp. SCN 63-374]|nr:MAG: flagellar biosynthesis protein FlgN [Thiobacillus sp. SCN 63-374]